MEPETRIGDGGDEHRWIGDRQLVDCDDNCLAFDKPETEDETRAAYVHWRYHGYLAGCSHAR